MTRPSEARWCSGAPRNSQRRTPPLRPCQYNAEFEAKLAEEIKQRIVADYMSTLDKKDAVAGEEDLFSNKSLFRVTNCLQVNIGRIHIRYEDDTAVRTRCSGIANRM